MFSMKSFKGNKADTLELFLTNEEGGFEKLTNYKPEIYQLPQP